MSKESKPQAPEGEPQMEKQNMAEPQEEFIGDEARPSRSMTEVHGLAGTAKAERTPVPPEAPGKR